jgi:hypothetical protein
MSENTPKKTAISQSPDQPASEIDRRGKGTPIDMPRGMVVDRRLFPDRRNIVVDGQRLNPDGSPATDAPGDFDRRRGPGRRLSDFTRSAEEGEMTREQFLFLMAIDEFKKANDKAYPTWTDVLEVVRLLGYRKTMKSEINLRRAEDWFEPSDTPSNVRPQRWSDRLKAPGERKAA